MTDDDGGKTIFQPSAKKTSMQFEVGDILNGVYEIKRFIAKGGMGEVYEAVNIHNTDERVAIKVMLPEFAADERVIAMFAKEAGMLTRLHHEAIVPYRLSSRDELGRPYLVTAYVDGPSLEDQFKTFRPTEKEFGKLARSLAEGLGKAHSLGAIHRDIAPDNVLLVKGNPGHPKIIDFGIAQDARAGQKGATIIGDGFAGKLNYVAPEQLGEYDRNIGPWTDIYSLALTLLAVASQKHADMGGSIASSVKKRMTVPDISAIPDRYQPAFQAALQPDPANRPKSMAEFIELLNNRAARKSDGIAGFEPLAGKDDKAATQDTSQVTEKLPLSSKSKVIGGAIAATILVVAASAFMLNKGPSEKALPKETVKNDTVPVTPEVIPSTTRLDAALLNKVTTEPKCSWLSYSDKNAKGNVDPAKATYSFVGGTGNLSDTRRVIERSLSRTSGEAVSVDLSQVVEFDSKFCGAVDAIESIKARRNYISSPDSSRTHEVKETMYRYADGSEKLLRIASPQFEVSKIPENQSVILLGIDTLGNFSPLAIGKDEIQDLVVSMGGSIESDGFVVPFATSLDRGKKDGHGFVVLAGDRGFSKEFFGDPLFRQQVPLTTDWAQRFSQMAAANNWTSDIFWYSIVDEIEG